MKKSLWLAVLCGLICTNYYILRNLKDALIITEAGAEVIPFLKTWALLPATVVLIMVFNRAASRLAYQKLFFAIVSAFLLLFFFFGFLIYPLGDALYLHSLSDRLRAFFPEGWEGFISMIRYWPLSFFYVLSESWATIVWYILFWGFANENHSFGEAQKHYPSIILSGNLSAILAGVLVNFLTFSLWNHTFWAQIALITVNGLLSLMIISFCDFVSIRPSAARAKGCKASDADSPSWGLRCRRAMQTEAPASSPGTQMAECVHDFGENKTFKQEDKMGFVESFKFIKNSPYFICLSIVVIGFNLIINFSEVVWKDHALSVYPHPAEYNAYMNKVTILIGALSTLITLFFVRFQREKWGWTAVAMATPFVTIGSALLFFLPLIFAAGSFLFLGSLHIVLSRCSRYTLLDMAKELAFIPFSSDEKLKAKTCIDGIGSRLGKSLASGIFQFLFLFLPSVAACTSLIFFLIVVIVFLSIASIYYIGLALKDQIC